MEKIIGITGGIGCGKSKIIQLMEKNYNVLNINTDNIAKDFMKEGNISYNLIVDFFGKEILTDGKINNKKLSDIVLNDKELLLKLNSFTHPYVISYVENLIKENREKYEIIVVESALLIDTKLKDFCDEIWNISATIETRIERLVQYRNYSKEKALEIINNQKNEKYYIENSNITIINDGATDKQILVIIKNILKGE